MSDIVMAILWTAYAASLIRFGWMAAEIFKTWIGGKRK